MPVKWFGEDWGAPVCDNEHVPTPVGMACLSCSSDLDVDDRGLILVDGSILHLCCLLRNIGVEEALPPPRPAPTSEEPPW